MMEHIWVSKKTGEVCFSLKELVHTALFNLRYGFIDWQWQLLRVSL